MATGQPALEGAQLVNEVVELVMSNSASSFTVAQYKKRADALLSKDLFNASLALGMLGTLAHDEAEMRKHFERAIQLRPGYNPAIGNYASSLYRMNFFSEASDKALDNYRIAPASPTAVGLAIDTCTAAFRVSTAKELLSQWEKIQPGVENKFSGGIHQALEYISSFQIPEKLVEQQIEFALKLLRESHHQATAWHLDFLSDEESTWMTYDLVLHEPVDVVVELNTQLAERMAGSDLFRKTASHVLVMYLVEDET